ncbi:23S rRNA (adenine(2030)-N(6))-methyltransferase RlmJ [Candidatus Saccharibacteria bacterium]|jgi:16S rRNA (guanine966-N2)-methyltransferase|nr:23S rRNA (adenine(2030)-N(6))-methyltransferase RlmJ [Candidatus Saccharibacteria bacterium]
MRIVSGRFKNIKLIEPKFGGVTHPMSEKIRGAIFNILGDLKGKSVLDAYAGSGALGIEALSRGADSVLFIEKHTSAFKVLQQNISLVRSQNKDVDIKVVKGDNQPWANKNSDSFDIVFLDPPFKEFSEIAVENLCKNVNKSGIVVLSTAGSVEAPFIDGVVVVDTRSYGDAALHIYRRDVS